MGEHIAWNEHVHATPADLGYYGVGVSPPGGLQTKTARLVTNRPFALPDEHDLWTKYARRPLVVGIALGVNPG